MSTVGKSVSRLFYLSAKSFTFIKDSQIHKSMYERIHSSNRTHQSVVEAEILKKADARTDTLPLLTCGTSVPMKLFGNFQGKHPKRVKMWSPLGRHDIHARGWKQDKWINDAPTRESRETGLKMWRQILTPTLTVHKGKQTSEEIYVLCIKGEDTRPVRRQMSLSCPLTASRKH
jgi:hypothetical protein